MKRLLFSVLMIGLSGCAVGPDYESPKFSFLDKWFSREDQHQAEDIQTDWWTVFGDPQLEGYIEKAVAENKTLAAARANVQRARALRRESSSGFFPDISGSASRERQGTSGTTSGTFSAGVNRTTYDASFDASWEADIFGGTRRAVEAADARLKGAIENRRAVLMSVLAEVARNYYEVRGIQKRITITEQNINLQQKTYDLIIQRYKLGEASEFDVSRARAEFQQTQSRLPDLNADLKAGIYRLSVLLGLPPESLLVEMTESKPLPVPPDVVPIGLRSDILRRRPDVRLAEQRLAAETADIGVAVSDLFPDFFLTGSGGSASAVFSDLFLKNSTVWSLTTLLQWPVYSGGQGRARVDVQKAEAKEALALYEQTVLDVLRDAETALVRYVEKLRTRTQLTQAVASRLQSVQFAKALFNSGEEDFLSVLDAERELASAEDVLVVSETQSVTNLIALYTALGGGWDIFEKNGAGH